MGLMVEGGKLVVALLCAGLMGFAIQRGGTCTVAAVGDIFQGRSFGRLVALALRIAIPVVRHRRRTRSLLTQSLWSSPAATTVIGFAFLSSFLSIGAWAFTDALVEIARGITVGLSIQWLLVAGLVVGSLIGGWSAGLFRHTGLSVATMARCIVGGSLMGAGSLMIPGGNDGLVLIGMPLLWPYAWVAFATMCATIGGISMLVRPPVGPSDARG